MCNLGDRKMIITCLLAKIATFFLLLFKFYCTLLKIVSIACLFFCAIFVGFNFQSICVTFSVNNSVGLAIFVITSLIVCF